MQLEIDFGQDETPYFSTPYLALVSHRAPENVGLKGESKDLHRDEENWDALRANMQFLKRRTRRLCLASSPKERAVRTAKEIREVFGVPWLEYNFLAQFYEERAYESIARMVRDDKYDGIVLVTHQPIVEGFPQWLVKQGNDLGQNLEGIGKIATSTGVLIAYERSQLIEIPTSEYELERLLK